MMVGDLPETDGDFLTAQPYIPPHQGLQGCVMYPTAWAAQGQAGLCSICKKLTFHQAISDPNFTSRRTKKS